MSSVPPTPPKRGPGRPRKPRPADPPAAEPKTEVLGAAGAFMPKENAPLSTTHRVAVEAREARSASAIAAEARQAELRGIEDELLVNSLDRMRHAINFAELPFDAQDVPAGFEEKYGERAHEIFRIMKAGQMSSKEAPVGLILANKLAVGIIKARASEKGGDRKLAVAVQVVTTAPIFEEKEVD